MGSERLFHGGKPGLNRGDLLVPSPPHVDDGCPICLARRAGRALTVGEFRAFLQPFAGRDVQARKALEMLDGADDSEPVDPPSGREAVYVTADEAYARWYAARSRGDLYLVAPVGQREPSTEDPFPSWTCQSARVVAVLCRNVRLRRRERRALLRRWQKADRRSSTPSPSGAPRAPETSTSKATENP